MSSNISKKGQTKKQLVLSLVETPKTLNSDKQTRKKLFSYITEEIRKNKCWTQNCSTALQESPSALFHFDRLQYLLANAFEDQRIRITMNPKMMMCYHPDCYNVKGKNPISMHDLSNIRRYVEHLMIYTMILLEMPCWLVLKLCTRNRFPTMKHWTRKQHHHFH